MAMWEFFIIISRALFLMNEPEEQIQVVHDICIENSLHTGSNVVWRAVKK